MTTRKRKPRQMLLLALCASLAAGGIVGAATALDARPSGLVIALILGGALGFALWASLAWWQSADEAVREAHKTGWYWGGSAGLVLAIGLMALLHFVDPEQSLDRFAFIPGDAGLLITGIIVTIAAQMIGYLLVWAGWWLMRGR